MFQTHKKSALLRFDEKKLSFLCSYENTKSTCLQSSTLINEKKKTSIGKFINTSKNHSIVCDQLKSNEYTNEASSGIYESQTLLHEKLAKNKNNNIYSGEKQKLGIKRSILQKILVTTMDMDAKNNEFNNFQKNGKNFDFSKYCKKVQVGKSLNTRCDKKKTIIRNKSNNKIVKSIYSKENMVMKIFEEREKSRQKILIEKIKTKRNSSLNDK